MNEAATMIPRDFAVPIVPVESCPIQASLGVLGRKWALLVLRDIAFYEKVRFSDILRKNAGLTPRILTFRLKELAADGLIQRMPESPGKRDVFYELTAKGADAIPILAAYLNFGMWHCAEVVFRDGKPRTLEGVLPKSQSELLGSLRSYALRERAPFRSANRRDVRPPKDRHG